MALRTGLVVGAVAVVALASLGLSSLHGSDPMACPDRPQVSGSKHRHAHGVDAADTADTDSMAGHAEMAGDAEMAGHGDMDGHVVTGPTCNTVEMTAPYNSSYVPDLSAASSADKASARRLLERVNEFCRTHTAAEITADWRPGTSNLTKPTHYYNPDPKARGLDPGNPKAALIYDGELGGVMFTGHPLPTLGSIPRAHSHAMPMRVEMVHVYCTPDLRDAYTPNRRLGVEADRIALRQRMRPAVGDLDPGTLRDVRARVRGYAGSELHVVRPVGVKRVGEPDPVLKAMRTEIRESLMVLSETELRQVWSSMRAAG